MGCSIRRDSKQRRRSRIRQRHRYLKPQSWNKQRQLWATRPEDRLFAADEVERIELAGDDLPSPRVIPESENILESQYELEFLDYAGRDAAKL